MSQEQVWDAIAESWNNFRQKPKQFAVEYSQNWSKGKILDIGSGNCRNLFPFAEKEFDCYGIDFSDEALKKAKQFCNKNKIKVNLKKADATSLPFKNKSFDYVLAIAIIHVIEKKENRTKVLSEIKRILKNNGRALITFWNKNPINLIFSKDEYVKWGKQLRFYHFYSINEIKKECKTAGLKIEKIKIIKYKKSKFKDILVEIS